MERDTGETSQNQRGIAGGRIERRSKARGMDSEVRGGIRVQPTLRHPGLAVNDMNALMGASEGIVVLRGMVAGTLHVVRLGGWKAVMRIGNRFVKRVQ